MHQRFETGAESQTRPVVHEQAHSWREQRFTPREVSEILSIATRLQSEGVKGEQILQMAEEAGIAPEHIERAVIEFQKRKWQRIEAELNMRRRLRRILMTGGVLIGLTGLLALWMWLGSRSSASYATSPPTSPNSGMVMPDYSRDIGRFTYGFNTYATSRSLSVVARRVVDSYGQALAEITIGRAGEIQAARVQVPNTSITQISIAPNERRIALIDSARGAVWVVNADGTGLNRVAHYYTPLSLDDGASVRITQHPFAGWDGDALILHTEKGSVRIRLTEGNTVVRAEWYKP
ncbi:MAG: hypothetical protein N2651_00840 [Fimbriimonadales bacterium]|nr:hypothetical protein [Fimbriimonadales bacterium]